MRKKIIGANWKMNLLFEETKFLCEQIDDANFQLPFELIVFPSSLYLSSVLPKNNWSLGAQDVYYEEKGAFTGAISPAQLKSINCRYVLIGHSERRNLFDESDALINQKLIGAIENELSVVFCCGEPIEVREKLGHLQFIENQLIQGLKGIDEIQMPNCVIAYEPMWAIGTGHNASKVEIEEMHGFIRQVLSKMYSSSCADGVRIIYGGSCNQNNAREIFSYQDVDGGLIGAASLRFDSLNSIIKSL